MYRATHSCNLKHENVFNSKVRFFDETRWVFSVFGLKTNKKPKRNRRERRSKLSHVVMCKIKHRVEGHPKPQKKIREVSRRSALARIDGFIKHLFCTYQQNCSASVLLIVVRSKTRQAIDAFPV